MSCVVTKQPHQLVDIMSKVYLGAEDARQIVRWCENCGAVVIDVDTDGRTYPGEVQRMLFPALARRQPT
jgi:hypothetical protein